jgi:hypothetical protein
MQDKPSKKVLLALNTRSLATWAAALESECVPIPCQSLAQARKALNSKVDVILCGVNFDSSRMFDLLAYVNEHPKLRNIPFICINGFEPTLRSTKFTHVKESIRLLGAEFVDYWSYKQKYGEGKAYEKLKNKLHDVIAQHSINA